MKNVIITIISAVAVLAALAWLTNRNAGDGNETVTGLSSSPALYAANAYFDFGKVSMAKGDVSRIYSVKNTGAAPVTIGKVYTSCMCTEASISLNGKNFGPFGMRGHGFIPAINEVVEPGKEFSVNVIFDPAAHGPAGVGKVSRTVFVENNAGRPLELSFSAEVTP